MVTGGRSYGLWREELRSLEGGVTVTGRRSVGVIKGEKPLLRVALAGDLGTSNAIKGIPLVHLVTFTGGRIYSPWSEE